MLLHYAFSAFALFTTLPFVSSHPHQQLDKRAVTLSGGRHPIGSGTYPRAAVRSDGSLIATWAFRDGAPKYIQVSKSPASAASWSAPVHAVTEPAATHNLDNPFIFQLSNGYLLLAYRNHDRTADNENSYTSYHLDVSRSTDGGATWSYLSTIVTNAAVTGVAGNEGVWEPFLRYAADGSTIQAYFSHTVNSTDQDSILRTSSDGGATWSGPTTVGGPNINARDGMVGVAPLDSTGNNLIMVFESKNVTGHFDVWSLTNSNGGTIWGNRRLVYRPANFGTKNAGAPQIARVNGILVTSFMTDEDNDGYTWPLGSSTKVVTSSNGGASWSSPTTVFPLEADWDGIVTVGSQALVLAGFNGVATGQFINVS